MSKKWRAIASEVCAEVGTPCFICSLASVQQAAQQLEHLLSGVPVRQWYVFKAHPIRDVVLAWKEIGYGVEVVSEFELRAALEVGYPPERILVNGVAKHAWLGAFDLPALRVHFDSAEEARGLVEKALHHDWRIGLRYHPTNESDPDEPEFGDQFGFTRDELPEAVSIVRNAGLNIEGVHFHLGSHVQRPSTFGDAIGETLAVCRDLNIKPRYLDCGGGLPVAEEQLLDVEHEEFDLTEYAGFLRAAVEMPDGVSELWLENGRFITSESTVLVVRVLDVKQRPDSRYLICDGGRTNHALVSDWQLHPLTTLPQRDGPRCHTTICGPTCMAFDRLTRSLLPRSIVAGDFIIWMNAGAYHIPWENRFSHGLAPVVVVDSDGDWRLSRPREPFEDWWDRWRRSKGRSE